MLFRTMLLELHIFWNCDAVGSILFSLSSGSFTGAFTFAAGVGDVAVLYSGDYVISFVFVASFAVGFAFWLSVLGECFSVGKSAV